MALPEKSTLDTVVDVFQTSCVALVPAIAVRYINTGDRTLDNALIAFITGLSTVFITSICMGLRNKHDFIVTLNIITKNLKYRCFRHKEPTEHHGFLTHELPPINLDDSKNRVSVYLLMGKALTKQQYSKIVIWLNNNIPVKRYVPYIEFTAGDGGFEPLTGFAKFNRSLIAYPFYYVDTDIVYWDMINTSTNEVRFSSTSQKALDFFMSILKKEGLLPANFSPFKEPEQKHEIMQRRTKIYNYQSNNSSLRFMADANTERSFDSLFFTQKDKLLRMVKKFADGSLYPKHIHSDNKLGILLYGPPGTGKSAFVIALANYLHKHIVIVDMTKIITCGNFEALMETDKDCILLFEEMDCVLGVLKKRDGMGPVQHPKIDEDYNTLMTLFTNTEDKEEKKRIMEKLDKHKFNKENALHLGYILQRLDGIFNETGRVIVGCTNHPELIDPALLRPGRFGIKVELGLCTKTSITDILAYYMELDPIQKRRVDEADLPENCYSPAELIQRIQMYYDEDVDKNVCLDKLIHDLRTRAGVRVD